MKIRESCLQTGNFIYKPGISLTKQDFHLQRGSLGLQRGFSGYYLPFSGFALFYIDILAYIYLHTININAFNMDFSAFVCYDYVVYKGWS